LSTKAIVRQLAHQAHINKVVNANHAHSHALIVQAKTHAINVLAGIYFT
jgi:hypothetical protein